MSDPVVAPSGITYEREPIEAWLRTRKEQGYPPIDPTTREVLPEGLGILYPNRALKARIDAWKAETGYT